MDPSIPADWDGFKVSRRFRDAVYEINVENPQHVSRGISSVTVDGKPHMTTLLPVFSDGKTHNIKIVMGASSGKELSGA